MSTADEILAMQAQAAPVIDRIKTALGTHFAHHLPPALRIAAKSVRGHRGRRARRQAFYDRQRTARLLQRVMMWTQPPIDVSAQVDDLLLYGLTWLEVSQAGTRRAPPREWRVMDGGEWWSDTIPGSAEHNAAERDRLFVNRKPRDNPPAV